MSWWTRAAPPDARRWVVVDVESSGLDPRHDRLLAIGAVAVRPDAAAPRILLADSHEVVLRQPDVPADKANVLVHGVGVGAQRSGSDPAEALAGFERWVGSAPLLAYHAAFDRALIERAMRAVLGRGLARPWLDLAALLAVLHPQQAPRALDDWLAHYGLRCLARHRAAADALVTAELLLRLWPQLRERRLGTDWASLAHAAGALRWLGR